MLKVYEKYHRKKQIHGTYDRLAAIHRGVFNLRSAHRGPNFFGWHRIYLLIFEWSLQRVNPTVTLPYWDSTLDFDTTNPTRSVVWTSRFFGNGNGLVTSGPFANWTTGQNERLMRNIGSSGTLMTKAGVDLVLSRNSHSEIIDTNNVLYYFEGYHDGPHVWVDGQMRVLESAAEDPNEAADRGISPENDYPNVGGLHAPNRRMAGFDRLSNVQGYLNHWTDTFYTYLESPTCGTTEPSCYSPFLTCDITRERCVTIEGEVWLQQRLNLALTSLDLLLLFVLLQSLQYLLRQKIPSKFKDNDRKTIRKNITNNDTTPGTIYIPISIVSYRPYPLGLESIVTTNGEIINNLLTEGHDHKSVHLKGGSSVAFVQSDGISYTGRYTDVTVTDIEHLVSSAFAHAVVKNPKNDSITAIITVEDNFGRICKPVCLQDNNATSPYKPCSGAIRVTSDAPKMFSFDA
ncbi:hypothetical protein KUTeg_019289 [Tegillarca granosa]|uniref:Tyrosinase copper-binding domain-containing protein n=1 Tax=Tegillarca granosa TaxID=220873 RepID=A0ABQ9EI21_TEGGR|nr:hypothetical protein KUTeg_019289 [Tegillarca granosa]